MEILNYLGILGLILIALGWIPQTIQTIKQKKSNLNFKFNLLYSIGSLSLVIYSVYISDLIFIILNSLAFLMSAIALFFTNSSNS